MSWKIGVPILHAQIRRSVLSLKLRIPCGGLTVCSCERAFCPAMSTVKLSQQLHRIASKWPVDPFRPHLQLGTFLKSLADHPQLTPQAVRAARALEENEFQRKVRSTRVALRFLE